MLSLHERASLVDMAYAGIIVTGFFSKAKRCNRILNSAISWTGARRAYPIRLSFIVYEDNRILSGGKNSRTFAVKIIKHHIIHAFVDYTRYE